MAEELLIGLALIIFIGILGQWVSWYFKLPSILLLLILGFVLGPITGVLNPDEFFGDLLFPFVSISVAIILFEGGLSLKISELRPVFGIVRNLVTIGTLVTWGLVTITAYYFTQLSFTLSLLLGAILVVTGPTVIVPLLRLVKPKGQINSILKWEGIVNDPIGALLALLVYESIISSGVTDASVTILIVIIKTILFSSILGLAGGYLLVYFIKKDFLPDNLQNPATLAVLVFVFASSNNLQGESGLFAVTLMGIYLANQKHIVIEHIVEFKENLGVLLLSVLFIVLAARLQIEELELINYGVIIFLALLILLIRPISIFFSTIGSKISWKEKLYLSWMAPRGIVAAAVASIFSLELEHNGIEEAKLLVPIMFLVIIATILVYGLSAIPLARILKIADQNPQGILIAGINKLSIEIQRTLKNYNLRVLLVDKNWEKVANARLAGIEAAFGSIVSEKTFENIDLEGIGKFIALTTNKGINSLSTLYYSKIFDSANVYQINTGQKENEQMSKHLRGNYFSSDRLTISKIELHDNNFVVKANNITAEFSFQNLLQKYETNLFFPLFIVNSENNLTIYSEKYSVPPKEGDTLISLIFNDIIIPK